MFFLFQKKKKKKIIDECNTQVGKMRQVEELIHVSQTLEFDKLKVNSGNSKRDFEPLGHSFRKSSKCFCPCLFYLFVSGHPDHLSESVSGEEGRAAGNVQRRNYLQHEGQVHSCQPLPLQRSAPHRFQEGVRQNRLLLVIRKKKTPPTTESYKHFQFLILDSSIELTINQRLFLRLHEP